MVTLLLHYKVDSDLELQTGFLHCEPGFTFILIFDNNHSIFTVKKLTYGISIQNLEERETPGNTEQDGKILVQEKEGKYVLVIRFVNGKSCALC